MCSIVQPPQKNYGGSFVRGPVPYSPDVPRKLNMAMAKVWRKHMFCSAKMSFSEWKKFRTTLIYNARSNSTHPPTSPNIAPETKSDSHDWSCSHKKRHLQCVEQQESSSNLTKYCACHAKWISWLIHVTYGTSFTMRGASKVTLQPHQVLRLPRNSEFKIWARNPWIASANRKMIRG